MKAYLDIVRRVLNEGKPKVPVRMVDGKATPVDGGVKTIGLPNVVFSHDMSEGFPLLTSKKMAIKSTLVELEGFINGVTDKRWYQERGCKFWDSWANPQVVEERLEDYNSPFGGSVDYNSPIAKEIKKEENDLGAIYGWNWRHFDQHYGDEPYNEDWHEQSNGVKEGADQLLDIVATLHTNYNDRRMVCSAWNPNQLHLQALPPCHLLWIVSVYDGKLNLSWTQRSVDVPLGLPTNIASYATLLLLLANEAGLKPGNLMGSLIDCHIYENQIDSAYVQLERDPRPLRS